MYYQVPVINSTQSLLQCPFYFVPQTNFEDREQLGCFLQCNGSLAHIPGDDEIWPWNIFSLPWIAGLQTWKKIKVCKLLFAFQLIFKNLFWVWIILSHLTYVQLLPSSVQSYEHVQWLVAPLRDSKLAQL